MNGQNFSKRHRVTGTLQGRVLGGFMNTLIIWASGILKALPRLWLEGHMLAGKCGEDIVVRVSLNFAAAQRRHGGLWG